jgi:hypothetical protein
VIEDGEERGGRAAQEEPMADIPPVVRHMLLCDDVRPNPDDPHKPDIIGLLNRIESESDPAFPLRYPVFCVYLRLTGGRGSGHFKIVVREADTDRLIFNGRLFKITFPGDPLAIGGLMIRVRDCVFSRAGLYWVRLVHQGRTLAQESLLLR